MRDVFIAGNGPSLKELDFEWLRSIDWLGMNAAYRYWDTIGVYPTIYSCLDKVVIKSHASHILRLHKEGRVKYFFLVKDILEAEPDFPQDDSVFFLEDLVQSADPRAIIFRTAFTDKKTTGSWAVRFAIFLGYRDIFLGGVDCNYVEIIDQAERTGVGLELKIGSDVDSNPNYFFNDYQKPGDVYQIPNPERHFGNLHLQSFEALNIDIARLGLDVTIRNTAHSSQLQRYGVYEYLPLSEATRSPLLRAVAVPLTASEHTQMMRNFRLWDTPAFYPLRPGSPLLGKIVLHLFFDCAKSKQITDAIELAWGSTTYLKNAFAKLEITFLGIPDDLNFYIRDPQRLDVPRKMGPNLHFLAMMRECERYRYTQLMETDCVPAKSDWLTDLNSFCSRSSPFWIAGGYLDAIGNVSAEYALHINGNAIYATGNQDFINFLDETFVPALHYLILDRRDYSLAYDCLISKVWTYGIRHAGRPQPGVMVDQRLMGWFETIQRHLDKFRLVSSVCNISHLDDGYTDDQLLALLDKDFVLVHSRRLSKLITDACLEAHNRFDMEWSNNAIARRFKDTFIKIEESTAYPFHYYSNLEGYVFDRFDRSSGGVIVSPTAPSLTRDSDPDKGGYVIFAVNHSVMGRKLSCQLTLLSETAQTMVMKLARHGEGRYTEDSGKVSLAPFVESKVTLTLDCADDYKNVRLFFKPVEGVAGRLKAWCRLTDNATQERLGKVTVHGDTGGHHALYNMFRGDAAGPLRLVPAQAPATMVPAKYPRLLMIDSTPLGHLSATGQLKKTFLEGWPRDSFLQVWGGGRRDASLHSLRIGESVEKSKLRKLSIEEVVQECIEFAPEVIYFRPIDSKLLLDVTRQVLDKLSTPLIIHMMDDWPSRMQRDDPGQFESFDVELRALVRRASIRLSICKAMSDAYGIRYGGKWIALANGADPGKFPAKNWSAREQVSEGRPFVARYMGALADDMTHASVKDVAESVSRLQSRYPVRFEIFTMDWCREKAERELGVLPGVKVFGLVAPEQYEQSLTEADALVIAYNFDERSIAYIGCSLANKMPECLASGTPILAYGPAQVATIGYLKEACVAEVVEAKDRQLLDEALQNLITNPDYCRELGARGRSFVSDNLAKGRVQQSFRNVVMEAASLGNGGSGVLIGPFGRDASAHYDETNCVSELFSGPMTGSVMIDVGAHHGWALSPFLKKGWRIYAFEPDNDNRKKLLERLKTLPLSANVKVDKRAVSDVSRSGLSFYRSEESTGISGLSAFHPTHKSEQTVDTITLAEVLADERIPGIDFLKIDTEGHDLFVLRGFPWDRFRPAVIECEFEDSKTLPLGYGFHDLAGFLMEKGYTVYVSEWHRIIRYGIRHDWRRLARYPCELADDKGWGNLIAFRDPIDERALVGAVEKVMSVAAHAPRTSASIPRGLAAFQMTHRYRIVPGLHFTPISEDRWRYSGSDTTSQKLWMAVFDQVGPITGRSFTSSIRLESNRAVTLMVGLGRHGVTGYEGTSRRITLTPGAAQSVQLQKTFANEHGALKIQIEVLEQGETDVELLMDSIGLGETLSSLRHRIPKDQLSMRAANRMFREQDYAAAMAVYLLLHAEHPLKMYVDNALMAAKKLGMESAQDVEDLLRHCSLSA